MTKKALVSELTRGSEGYKTAAEAERAIDRVFGAVEKVVRGGEPVRVVGFGTFEAKHRAGRVGKNPQTGESINIQPKTVLGFKSKLAL